MATYNSLCQDLGLDDSVAELVATRKSEETIGGSQKTEVSQTVSLCWLSFGRRDDVVFSAETTESTAQTIRVLAERTLIVGDYYQLERAGQGGERVKQLTRCTWCRLRDQERFDAELRLTVGG